MEHLPGMSEREVMEGLKPDDIIALVQRNLGQIAMLKSQISLASDVLIGAYGIDIDRVLEERENETKITST